MCIAQAHPWQWVGLPPLTTHHSPLTTPSPSHLLADLDLAIDVLYQIPDHAAVLVIADQRLALRRDAAKLVELPPQVAHDVVDRTPVDLVVRQTAHLLDNPAHLIGKLVAQAAEQRHHVAHHGDGTLLDTGVAGMAPEDIVDLREHVLHVIEALDLDEIQIVKLVLWLIGADLTHPRQGAAGLRGLLV